MKLVILDRDGVINEDSAEFIKSAAEFKPLTGSLEAIARLNHAGYRVFIATNQSGIGRGLFGYDALGAIHDRLKRELAELGGRIDGIAIAPEHPDAASNLRKPAPGMLQDIARRMQVDLAEACFVGDSLRDIQAAQAAGARPVLVRTGNGQQTEDEADPALAQVPVYDDLAAFVDAELAA